MSRCSKSIFPIDAGKLPLKRPFNCMTMCDTEAEFWVLKTGEKRRAGTFLAVQFPIDSGMVPAGVSKVSHEDCQLNGGN